MINGDTKEFIGNLYNGQEMWIVYNGKEYFIQGYNKDEFFHLEINEVYHEDEFWEKFCNKEHQTCVEEFLVSKLFEGKTFWEVEKEIKWID